MSETTSIVSSIDQRLEELADEIQQLEQARSALTAAAGVETASTVAAAAGNGAARPARRSRRVRNDANRQTPMRRENVEQLLSATAVGMSANTIAQQTGEGYQATLRLLRELEAADRVRREGTRRSTRWRLITDEDRIAERAAELERQLRSSMSR
jgi:predicted Rossmann fold nucleotide-binding protein DprA/Smf involved in DNA uptake